MSRSDVPSGSRRNQIVYYITSHGYGHGVRSCDILRALFQPASEGLPSSAEDRLSAQVVTELDRDFLRSRLPPAGIEFRRRAFDVGMVQLDSVRVDLPATEKRLAGLCRSWNDRVDEEIQFLQQVRPGVVVCDIPGIPLQAAARLQIPTIAVGNFSWNWIYGEFAAGAKSGPEPAAGSVSASVWREAMDLFESAYSACDLLLRLPFAEPMNAFSRQEDVPLLSSPSTPDRAGLSRLTGADPGRFWVLLSFTTLDWDAEAVASVAALDGYEFFTVEPLTWPGSGIHSLARDQMPFAEVLASVDAVVSKPGYGIVSECVVNEKPLLYADRQNFLEYPILVAAIERYLCQAHLPSADLYAGKLGPGLAALRSAPSPKERPARGGERVVADRILATLDTFSA